MTASAAQTPARQTPRPSPKIRRCASVFSPTRKRDRRPPRGYVEDVAEAIALCVACEEAAGRVYHVGDKENLTEAECVRRIGRAAGWNGDVLSLPNECLPSALQHHYDARQDWSLDSS